MLVNDGTESPQASYAHYNRWMWFVRWLALLGFLSHFAFGETEPPLAVPELPIDRIWAGEEYVRLRAKIELGAIPLPRKADPSTAPLFARMVNEENIEFLHDLSRTEPERMRLAADIVPAIAALLGPYSRDLNSESNTQLECVELYLFLSEMVRRSEDVVHSNYVKVEAALPTVADKHLTQHRRAQAGFLRASFALCGDLRLSPENRVRIARAVGRLLEASLWALPEAGKEWAQRSIDELISREKDDDVRAALELAKVKAGFVSPRME